MIALNSTRSLEILLSGAVTTNQLPWTASYVDYDPTNSTYTSTPNDGQTNGTTAVTVVSAPASGTQRTIKRVNVYNADTAPATVTVRLSDAGNLRTQLRVTLQVGERIEYEDSEGFRVFTVNGAVKVTAVASTVEPGYIDGLIMQWNSASSVTITSGTAYIPSVGANVNLVSDDVNAGLSLSANTWYHVYLYLNAGVPDIEIVTTVPSSPYNGTARTKSGDTTRRYIGSIRTGAAGIVFAFKQTANVIEWMDWIGGAPFQVLAGGNATTPTDVDCSAAVPVTSHIAILSGINSDALVPVLTGTSDQGTTLSATTYNGYFNNASTMLGPYLLNSAQVFKYMFNSAPAGTLLVRVHGYSYAR